MESVCPEHVDRGIITVIYSVNGTKALRVIPPASFSDLFYDAASFDKVWDPSVYINNGKKKDVKVLGLVEEEDEEEEEEIEVVEDSRELPGREEEGRQQQQRVQQRLLEIQRARSIHIPPGHACRK